MPLAVPLATAMIVVGTKSALSGSTTATASATATPAKLDSLRSLALFWSRSSTRFPTPNLIREGRGRMPLVAAPRQLKAIGSAAPSSPS